VAKANYQLGVIQMALEDYIDQAQQEFGAKPKHEIVQIGMAEGWVMPSSYNKARLIELIGRMRWQKKVFLHTADYRG
jgi:hypothetical protein